ncbi:MAG: DNA repair protein RadA [Caldiserica bacterium]|nr:MAG: DNA repair protein RadA [Caldisericota bacterium]
MKKEYFVCKNCGYQTIKWLGQCPYCEGWDTFERVVERKGGIKKEAVYLKDIKDVCYERIKTGIEEFDRVTGGGVVKAEIILIAGPPGVGKSTLFLQIADRFSNERRVLYVTSEESLEQIKLRASRIGIKGDILFLDSNQIMEIINVIERIKPEIVFVDSIQGINSFEKGVPLGTPTQIRFGAEKFCEIAKEKGIVIFLSGHVTKEGIVAGPKLLEHIVDAVLYLEIGKDSFYRVLSSYKNRFGSTNEVAFFYLGERGFEEIKDLSFLISKRRKDAVGRVYTVIIQGKRAVTVEIESLVSISSTFPPRRQAVGLDVSKLYMLVAIIQKNFKIDFSKYDIFLKVSSGISIKESDADLPVILSILSSRKNFLISKDLIVIGEVSLTGELRGGYFMREKIKEAKRIGFKRFIVPDEVKGEVRDKGIFFVKDLKDVLKYVS